MTRKPPWLKKKIPLPEAVRGVENILKEQGLFTVCREARCPNQGECFSRGTATFLILGDRCTRSCTFCAVGKGQPQPPDEGEPGRVGEAVAKMGIDYAVITSVTRDDLPDGGAAHFARTMAAIRERSPNTPVEVLVPDFKGDEEALVTVLKANPAVLNHNLETVPRLYPEVRPQASFERSLRLLARARALNPAIPTKTGVMLGMGEQREELRILFEQLAKIPVAILTLGQYLAPGPEHYPVSSYVSPEIFQDLAGEAESLGIDRKSVV
jgi:lipoic acid synthetase